VNPENLIREALFSFIDGIGDVFLLGYFSLLCMFKGLVGLAYRRR
jgi:hypothetical protein